MAKNLRSSFHHSSIQQRFCYRISLALTCAVGIPTADFAIYHTLPCMVATKQREQQWDGEEGFCPSVNNKILAVYNSFFPSLSVDNCLSEGDRKQTFFIWPNFT